MKWDYYRRYIISTNTIVRSDITPLFENPKVFRNLITDLIKQFKKTNFNKIVSVDALGFVLGSAIAYKLKKPLVLIRKEKKFPYKKRKLLTTYFIDYSKTKKGLEIKKDSINKRDKVLLVDEWIHTGTQIKAAINLVERLGGKIIGISTIYLRPTKNTKTLLTKYNCKPIRISK